MKKNLSNLWLSLLTLFVLSSCAGAESFGSCEFPTSSSYGFQLHRVTDGDTLVLMVDLGFDTFRMIKARLNGVNTPEKYGVKKWADSRKTTFTEEYAKGQAATDFTAEWLESNCSKGKCKLLSYGTGKYGRWIVDVVSPDGSVLNDALVDSGHAVRVDY